MYPVDGLTYKEGIFHETLKHSHLSTNIWWGILQEQKELQNAWWKCWWCYSDSVVGVQWNKANEQECDVLTQSFPVWLSTRGFLEWEKGNTDVKIKELKNSP